LGLRDGIAFAGSVLVLWLVLLAPAAHAATPTPEEDPFYAYHGVVPLADIAPGTVLKTRTLAYHVAGVPLPVKAVQLLYRSSGEIGQPTVNVTSVLEPPRARNALGGIIPNIEALLIAPELLAGDAVVVADTEGETANFAAGPEYGLTAASSARPSAACSSSRRTTCTTSTAAGCGPA
jgi:hypothetical protein